MATRRPSEHLPFLIAAIAVVGYGCSDEPKPSPMDAASRPGLAEAGAADVPVLDVRADPPADSLPDLAAEGMAADPQDVAPTDTPALIDLAAPDSHDGSGETLAVLDVGEGTAEVTASPDLAKRDLPLIDVQRPDSIISECAFYKTRSSLYVPPRFDFSLVQPDGSSLSCATRFGDGGDTTWKQPMTGRISGWVTAVSSTELRVDLCAPGLPCEPAEYRFTVSARGLALPSIPIGRRVTVSWWMQYGGWVCPRMLLVTDDASSDAGAEAPTAVWLAGVESMSEPKLPLPFAVGVQQLYCNPDPDAGMGCGNTGLLPDDYAFVFVPQTGEPPLLLGTSQSGTLAITLGNGTAQHLSLLTLRSFVTGACDDYNNWAWWGVGHAGPSGDPD